jgi:Ras-related protein Rab-7A
VQVESAFHEAAQFALAQENTDADYIPETINLNTPQPTSQKKGCC